METAQWHQGGSDQYVYFAKIEFEYQNTSKQKAFHKFLEFTLFHFGQTRDVYVATRIILLSSTAEGSATSGYAAAT